MFKILFVCHGNICRSPMAEMVMKNIIKNAGLQDSIYVDSAACRRDEIGSSMHSGTRSKLLEKKVPFTDHRARLVTEQDYRNFDLIIAMDEENICDLDRKFSGDPEKKCHRLLHYAGIKRDVADPWYTGNFDATWDDVLKGCAALLEHIKKI